ncbi:MAG: hypothetical protein II587_02475, partial [Oscillospiraceae bacterium]|nr:hypothetical protein [Oscillospiraceae bacterium]
MEENNNLPQNGEEKKIKRSGKSNNLIWVLILTILLYVFVASLGGYLLGIGLLHLRDWSPA